MITIKKYCARKKETNKFKYGNIFISNANAILVDLIVYLYDNYGMLLYSKSQCPKTFVCCKIKKKKQFGR